MKFYVRPTCNGENFTAGKLYEIKHGFGSGRVVVINDIGDEIIVRVDGLLSSRLGWRGKFERVSIPDIGEVVKVATENVVSDAYKEAVADATGNSWAIKKIGNLTVSDGKIYSGVTPRNEYAEVLEKLREVLRVPDGENILTHAKVVRVLADGVNQPPEINSTNC